MKHALHFKPRINTSKKDVRTMYVTIFTSVNFYVILALGITVQKGTVFFLSEFLWQRENNSLTQIFQLFLALLGRNSGINCP